MNDELKDWHKADIVAALHKKNTSLAQVSREAGLKSPTLGNALNKPWPRGEKLIAAALGIEPHIIWPSRYHDRITGERLDRQPKQRKPRQKNEN